VTSTEFALAHTHLGDVIEYTIGPAGGEPERGGGAKHRGGRHADLERDRNAALEPLGRVHRRPAVLVRQVRAEDLQSAVAERDVSFGIGIEYHEQEQQRTPAGRVLGGVLAARLSLPKESDDPNPRLVVEREEVERSRRSRGRPLPAS
jgi:hypothetical protein